MDRLITNHLRDESGADLVRLDCGHRVASPTSDATRLDCARCDAGELPKEAAVYNTSPDWDEKTVPAKILANHTTKSGVWGRICVLEGSLRYVIPSRGHEETIVAGSTGIVIPEVEHFVEPLGHVRFHVEFMRVP